MMRDVADTRYRWAAAVLRQLGIHQTPGGVAALAGWARAEGGNWHNDAHFNPLNTTLNMPGAGNAGTQGNIKQYRDWRQGIEATAKTLQSSSYAGIRHALAAGNPDAVAAAVAASPWDVAHYRGRDLAGILRSMPRIAGVQPLGGAVGDGSGGAARAASVPGATTTTTTGAATPNLQSGVDLTGLLSQLTQGSSGPPVSAPAAPAHAAAPVLPQGYQSPVSSAVPAASTKPDLGALLESIRGQGAPASTPGATTTTTSSSPAAAGGGSGKPIANVQDALTRAATIDAKRLPYSYGGGHGGRVDPSKAAPLDCSGAVSAVLGIDPRVSGDFEKFGSPGASPSGKGITIYANKTHVLMQINGHFFGTSGANPGGGAGWIPRSQIPADYLKRFTARHLAAAG